MSSSVNLVARGRALGRRFKTGGVVGGSSDALAARGGGADLECFVVGVEENAVRILSIHALLR